MKAEKFVNELNIAMPTYDELESYGLDEDEIEDIQASFKASPHGNCEAVVDGTGEIGRLIRCFDCSTLEIGLIHFDNELSSQPTGLRFGLCEADPLLVNPDGAIVIHDHSALNDELFRCSSSPDKFLDALAVFLQVQSAKSEWKGRAEEAAERCCSASGEELSRPFYRMLCSFLE